jgi:hypothetical protein
MRFGRIVLAVLGAAFVAQGTLQFFLPELLTNLIGVSAQSRTGRIELQVIYGGLHIALGSICLWGAAHDGNTRAALTMMFFVAAGVAIPRVGLGLYYQDFSGYSLVAMGAEGALMALIWVSLKLYKR